MASFVVMESPDRDSAAYVRDGFHFWAFVAPPLWLLVHRLWIEAAAVLALILALGFIGQLIGIGTVGSLFSLLASLWVGLEAPAMRIAALRRRGWKDAGVVDAVNRDEAEIRHLHDLAEDAPGNVAAAPVLPGTSSAQPLRPAALDPALGMVTYPGLGR